MEELRFNGLALPNIRSNNAAGERSFSATRRLKTWKRSTMEESINEHSLKQCRETNRPNQSFKTFLYVEVGVANSPCIFAMMYNGSDLTISPIDLTVPLIVCILTTIRHVSLTCVERSRNSRRRRRSSRQLCIAIVVDS